MKNNIVRISIFFSLWSLAGATALLASEREQKNFNPRDPYDQTLINMLNGWMRSTPTTVLDDEDAPYPPIKSKKRKYQWQDIKVYQIPDAIIDLDDEPSYQDNGENNAKRQKILTINNTYNDTTTYNNQTDIVINNITINHYNNGEANQATSSMALPPRFSCPLCSSDYGRRADLKSHFALKHFQNLGDFPELALPNGKYACTFCPQKFSRKKTCETHINRHIKQEKEKNFYKNQSNFFVGTAPRAQKKSKASKTAFHHKFFIHHPPQNDASHSEND